MMQIVLIGAICFLAGGLVGLIGGGRGYNLGWRERNDQAFGFEKEK